ncbi:uncharacterized protein [Epargyreus clarus]|uniref:uncharacterized protein n=1 Tax=Epargyreus clarus TaxID=520877 RepID=UPI003C2CC8E9
MHDLRAPELSWPSRVSMNVHRQKLQKQSSSNKLAASLKDSRSDNLLRAKSVSLAERPRSQYVRNARSADSNRLRYTEKQFFHHTIPNDKKRHYKPSNVVVKKQNRKVVEKVPFAVSVQNLSIPMTYADNPRNSTSKPRQNVHNSARIDNRNKSSNPKQVSDKKRLCQTVSGKETENKLLLQISEAEQVSDFERILNSNAILWERAHGHVWRGSVAAQTPSASFLPRPRSSYSLRAVSQAYHYLFQQHEDSLQPLINRYRQENAEDRGNQTASLLENNWYENLQDLSEFYEDDPALQQEIESITDRIIAEEVKASEGEKTSTRSKNFNVNLASLISLHVNGEGVSPTSPYRDDFGPSPEIDKSEACDDKEWLEPIMSANSDDRDYSHDNSDLGVDCLAQSLNTVQIDCDAKVPAITFSNCCDGRTKGDTPSNPDVVIHLTVPTIENVNESRPPMM